MLTRWQDVRFSLRVLARRVDGAGPAARNLQLHSWLPL